ncbi:hypothetical protein QCA50_017660 [Cerrena zonata]|uniref:Mitochondrial distribution and morphology protein 12 n=1 Tax=Cerrena zonata TaxID=2478898 RepID=A0AAW0FEH8_9APHY
MSFDINWDNLVSDNAINESIKEFLDSQFQNLSLPSYIADLSVTNFTLGNTPPDITIRHISDPFDEFYENEDEEDQLLGKNGNDSPQSMGNNLERDQPMSKKSSTNFELSDDTNDDMSSSSGDSEDDYSDDGLANTTTLNGADAVPPEVPVAPTLNRSRMALDSIFQVHNSFGHLHNYNMNNVGLGSLNNVSTHVGTDTPTNIFSQNPYNNLRANNTSANKNNSGPYKLLNTTKKSPVKDDNDIQFIVEIDYHGDLQMEHSVFFSFLCDINENNSDYFSSSHRNSATLSHQHSELNVPTGGNFVDYVTGPLNRERIDIIKKVHIESAIGELENNVLRNVGKVERFLVDQLRSIIRDEIAWPGWVCFDLNDDDTDDDENEYDDQSDDTKV